MNLPKPCEHGVPISHCKSCFNAQARRARAMRTLEQKTRERAQRKQYRETHAEEIAARQKAYHEAHKVELNARGRENYRKNAAVRAAYQRKRRAEHPEAVRGNMDFQGRTIAGMVEAQQGRCKICGEEFTATGNRQRVIDHNHQTRAVRAPICRGHNSMLGMAEDNPAVLRAGAAYLETEGTGIDYDVHTLTTCYTVQ